MQAVDIDDADLGGLPVDAVALGMFGLPTPYQVADPLPPRVEPALERSHGALGQPAAPRGVLVIQVLVDDLAQLVEVLHRIAGVDDGGLVVWVVLALPVQVGLHPGHQVCDLRSFVLRLGEQEPQVAFSHELPDGPVVGLHAILPAGRGRDGLATRPLGHRRPQAH